MPAHDDPTNSGETPSRSKEQSSADTVKSSTNEPIAKKRRVIGPAIPTVGVVYRFVPCFTRLCIFLVFCAGCVDCSEILKQSY